MFHVSVAQLVKHDTNNVKWFRFPFPFTHILASNAMQVDLDNGVSQMHKCESIKGKIQHYLCRTSNS